MEKRKEEGNAVAGRKQYILLHGFCLDHRIWDESKALVEEEMEIFTPDLPGFGKEAALREVLTMEALATWLRQWAQNRGLHHFSLLGHSLGGYIALEYARKYPEDLEGLGLIHSHAFGDNETKRAERQRAADFIARHGSVPYLRESIPALFSESFRIRKAAVVADVISRSRHIDPDVIIRYLKAMSLRSNREEVLKNWKRPALFVMGAHDSLIPLNENIRQSLLTDVSSVKIIEDAGHMAMLEDPEQVGQALFDFDYLLKHYES